jgi:hypothetical protein
LAIVYLIASACEENFGFAYVVPEIRCFMKNKKKIGFSIRVDSGAEMNAIRSDVVKNSLVSLNKICMQGKYDHDAILLK